MALAAADTYVVVLALTDMMSGVGLGVESIQRATPIISGFLLGYIAVLPLIGRLADVISRHKILLGCLVIFIIGSAITALATEMSVLVRSPPPPGWARTASPAIRCRQARRSAWWARCRNWAPCSVRSSVR